MSVESEISILTSNMQNAYIAVSNKGGTLPSAQNMDNLVTAISSIPSGGGSFIGIPREVKNGVFQMPIENFTFSLPNDVTNVGTYALSYAFYGCTGLTSIDLSSLTTVGDYALYDAFYDCTGLTSIDLSSLTTVGSNALSNAFRFCSGLTDIYFRALTTSSFGSYKNQFNNMMSSTGSTKTHTIHFPSNLQSKISSLTGYPLFGGSDGYVVLAYDLPATS